MILSYNGYTHDDNEATIVMSRRAKTNDRTQTEGYVDRWTIDGVLHAASAAALTTALQALATAYSTDGGDAILYLPDGVTETAHALRSSATTSGVRVIEAHYPEGGGAEYTTFRSYQIVLEAETTFASSGGGGNQGLQSYTEIVTFSGGGPRFAWLQPLVGPPVRQLIHQQTTYKAMQAGSAIGRNSYPTPNLPLWPQAEHIERRQLARKSPERSGLNYVNYEVTWQYEFEAAVAMSGSPRVR